MSGLQAFLLGLVQGLTEFLPVSSSGHLVMAQALLGVVQEGIVFEIAVHVATLLAIAIFYRRRIGGLAAGCVRREADALGYVAKLGLATLPAVAVALVGGHLIEALFERPAATGLALIATGALLFSTRRTLAVARAAEPTWAGALLIGCAQAAAMLPGISRSGATVVAALAVGVRPVPAAEFSFLLGMIAIVGAAAWALPELSGVPGDLAVPLAVAASAALVSGLVAIWLFVRMLRRQTFHRFAYYLWLVGPLFLAWLWTSH